MSMRTQDRARERARDQRQEQAGQAVRALTGQILAWISGGARTYAQAMDAWRTSCPRLTIWEDAISDGLVRVERDGDGTMKHARVALTAKGGAGAAKERHRGPAPKSGGSRIPTPDR